MTKSYSIIHIFIITQLQHISRSRHKILGLSSLFCVLVWFQFKKLPKVQRGRKFSVTRKTKFFHLKNKTFLEVGPRTQNKHSYQAATTIMNCKSKVPFLLLLSLHIKTFFKLLVQNKILFCSYLFPWSRLTEFTARLKYHQILELGLGVEIIGPQRRGNSPLSPPW